MDSEPSIIDILRFVNDQGSEESLKGGMFNRFRYHRLFASDICKYEGLDEDSLLLLLQVIYLDMNGVSNVGNAKNKPVFNLKSATKSPDLLGEIRTIRLKLGIEMDQMEKEFCRSASDVMKEFSPRKAPLSPKEIWPQISRMIE